MSAIALDELHTRVRELPALPKVVTDLLAALRRDDVAIDQLALTIAHDQALTAKTLRLANCPFYGVPGRVTSIRDAINILGVRSLASAMTAAAVAGSFAQTHCKGFDFGAYWTHSIGTALCAQTVARSLRLDDNTAFTAGLLHDIGRLALASCFPLPYAAAIEWRAARDCQMLDAEKAVLGMDHAEVGARIARHWNFAPVVIEAIAGHHCPASDGQASLVDIVHVADNIAHALDLAAAEDELVPPLSLPSWQRLAVTPEQCERVFHCAESELADLREALTA